MENLTAPPTRRKRPLSRRQPAAPLPTYTPATVAQGLPPPVVTLEKTRPKFALEDLAAPQTDPQSQEPDPWDEQLLDLQLDDGDKTTVRHAPPPKVKPKTQIPLDLDNEWEEDQWLTEIDLHDDTFPGHGQMKETLTMNYGPDALRKEALPSHQMGEAAAHESESGQRTNEEAFWDEQEIGAQSGSNELDESQRRDLDESRRDDFDVQSVRKEFGEPHGDADEAHQDTKSDQVQDDVEKPEDGPFISQSENKLTNQNVSETNNDEIVDPSSSIQTNWERTQATWAERVAWDKEDEWPINDDTYRNEVPESYPEEPEWPKVADLKLETAQWGQRDFDSDSQEATWNQSKRDEALWNQGQEPKWSQQEEVDESSSQTNIDSQWDLTAATGQANQLVEEPLWPRQAHSFEPEPYQVEVTKEDTWQPLPETEASDDFFDRLGKNEDEPAQELNSEYYPRKTEAEERQPQVAAPKDDFFEQLKEMSEKEIGSSHPEETHEPIKQTPDIERPDYDIDGLSDDLLDDFDDDLLDESYVYTGLPSAQPQAPQFNATSTAYNTLNAPVQPTAYTPSYEVANQMPQAVPIQHQYAPSQPAGTPQEAPKPQKNKYAPNPSQTQPQAPQNPLGQPLPSVYSNHPVVASIKQQTNADEKLREELNAAKRKNDAYDFPMEFVKPVRQPQRTASRNFNPEKATEAERKSSFGSVASPIVPKKLFFEELPIVEKAPTRPKPAAAAKVAVPQAAPTPSAPAKVPKMQNNPYASLQTKAMGVGSAPLQMAPLGQVPQQMAPLGQVPQQMAPMGQMHQQMPALGQMPPPMGQAEAPFAQQGFSQGQAQFPPQQVPIPPKGVIPPQGSFTPSRVTSMQNGQQGNQMPGPFAPNGSMPLGQQFNGAPNVGIPLPNIATGPAPGQNFAQNQLGQLAGASAMASPVGRGDHSKASPYVPSGPYAPSARGHSRTSSLIGAKAKDVNPYTPASSFGAHVAQARQGRARGASLTKVDPNSLLQRQFPIFHWGPKVVVMIPPENDGYTPYVRNIGVIKASELNQDAVHALFPGPLSKGKTKKKEVQTWLEARAEALTKNPSSPAEELLLCQVMLALTRHNAQFKDSAFVNEVAALLTPNIDYVAKHQPPPMHGIPVANAHQLDAQEASVVWGFLQCGDTEGALNFAMARNDWALSFILAHSLGSDRFAEVSLVYTRQAFPFQKTTHASAQHLMPILMKLFVGNHQSVLEEFTAVSAAGDFARKHYREIVAASIANGSLSDFLSGFGAYLASQGLETAAEICYILGGAILSAAPGAFVHVGGNTSTSVYAEIYEWLLQLGDTIPAPLPHLVPVKLRRAQILSDFGLFAESKRYCDYLGSFAKSKTPLAHDLNMLVMRIQSADSRSFGSILGFEKMWLQLDKFMGVDSDLKQSELGVFSKFSPGVSRTASTVDISQMNSPQMIGSRPTVHVLPGKAGALSAPTNIKYAPPVRSRVPLDHSPRMDFSPKQKDSSKKPGFYHNKSANLSSLSVNSQKSRGTAAIDALLHHSAHDSVDPQSRFKETPPSSVAAQFDSYASRDQRREVHEEVREETGRRERVEVRSERVEVREEVEVKENLQMRAPPRKARPAMSNPYAPKHKEDEAEAGVEEHNESEGVPSFTNGNAPVKKPLPPPSRAKLHPPRAKSPQQRPVDALPPPIKSRGKPNAHSPVPIKDLEETEKANKGWQEESHDEEAGRELNELKVVRRRFEKDIHEVDEVHEETYKDDSHRDIESEVFHEEAEEENPREIEEDSTRGIEQDDSRDIEQDNPRDIEQATHHDQTLKTHDIEKESDQEDEQLPSRNTTQMAPRRDSEPAETEEAPQTKPPPKAVAKPRNPYAPASQSNPYAPSSQSNQYAPRQSKYLNSKYQGNKYSAPGQAAFKQPPLQEPEPKKPAPRPTNVDVSFDEDGRAADEESEDRTDFGAKPEYVNPFQPKDLETLGASLDEFPIPGSPEYTTRANSVIGAAAGLQLSKLSQSQQSTMYQQYEVRDDTVKSYVPVPEEEDEEFKEKPAKARSSSPDKEGWLKNWLSKKDDGKPKPIRAKLGQPSTFEYSETHKRWIDKSRPLEEQLKEAAPPPPPKRKDRAPTMPPPAAAPMSPKMSGLATQPAPRARKPKNARSNLATANLDDLLSLSAGAPSTRRKRTYVTPQ